LVISHPNLWVWGMKNEFSYYITMPLITRPVVINPDHLLLYGLQTHTDQESISHITYSTHSLSHASSFSFFFIFLSVFFLIFLHFISVCWMSSIFLCVYLFIILWDFFSPFHSFLLPLFQQSQILFPLTISATSPTSSFGRMRWSMIVAGRCFPVPDACVKMTLEVASFWRTRGPPSWRPDLTALDQEKFPSITTNCRALSTYLSWSCSMVFLQPMCEYYVFYITIWAAYMVLLVSLVLIKHFPNTATSQHI